MLGGEGVEGRNPVGVLEGMHGCWIRIRDERIAACFQHQDLQAVLGEARRNHRTACTAADDDVVEGALPSDMNQNCLR